MKASLLALLLSLFACAVYPWELGLTSRTSLSPTAWTEVLGIGVGHGAWDVRAEAEFDATGLLSATVGIGCQTGSFLLGGEIGFDDAGFSHVTGNIELQLTEYFGLSADATVDTGGFAGATLSVWYEVGVEEGSSGFTGVLELDHMGAVVGQTLRFGLYFPPVSLETTAWFDELGFSSLELSVDLLGEWAAAGASLSWDSAGLRSVGGSVSTTVGELVASGEFSWLVEGDWTSAAEVDLGGVVLIQGEFSHWDGDHSWEVGVGVSLEYVEVRAGLGGEGGGLRYTGCVTLRLEGLSAEFRGDFPPDGEWRLEVALELYLSMGEENEEEGGH